VDCGRGGVCFCDLDAGREGVDQTLFRRVGAGFWVASPSCRIVLPDLRRVWMTNSFWPCMRMRLLDMYATCVIQVGMESCERRPSSTCVGCWA